MSEPNGDILHVSDTALMVAACRAIETARPDGFVRDPFAERLAGERGMAIARALPRLDVMCFGVGVRSRFMDELVTDCVAANGIRAVLSVGCGLDTRPWRLLLPSALRWLEVDFPHMLEYKAAALADETPHCIVERLPVDISDDPSRNRMFAAAGEGPALLVTEGLLGYLPAATITGLAEAPNPAVRYWLTEIVSRAFAAIVRMDSFQQVQNVRAETHIDGDQTLEILRRNGWDTVKHRNYLMDVLPFGAPRLKAAAAARAAAGGPTPSVRPDDPTGVHLLTRK